MVSKERRKELRDKLDPRLFLCYDYILVISENRILATHGGNISLITFNGNILFTADSIYVPEYPKNTEYDNSEQVEKAIYDYVDELLIYVMDGKEGLIDYDGNIIVNANYKQIQFLSNDNVEIMP